MLFVAIHQSIHNKDNRDYLACSSIDSARFHITCPWFRSSQLRARSLAFPSCREPQTCKSQGLLCRNTLRPHETTSHYSCPTPSILPGTFSNIQVPRGRAAVIVSGLPRSVLAERLACEPPFSCAFLEALFAMTFFDLSRHSRQLPRAMLPVVVLLLTLRDLCFVVAYTWILLHVGQDIRIAPHISYLSRLSCQSLSYTHRLLYCRASNVYSSLQGPLAC
jgi:hypothetical protein